MAQKIRLWDKVGEVQEKLLAVFYINGRRKLSLNLILMQMGFTKLRQLNGARVAAEKVFKNISSEVFYHNKKDNKLEMNNRVFQAVCKHFDANVTPFEEGCTI
jgi:hypothetical protein